MTKKKKSGIQFNLINKNNKNNINIYVYIFDLYKFYFIVDKYINL